MDCLGCTHLRPIYEGHQEMTYKDSHDRELQDQTVDCLFQAVRILEHACYLLNLVGENDQQVRNIAREIKDVRKTMKRIEDL